MIKKVLFVSMVAASVVAISAPVAAAVYVQIAPPALQVETVPAPRHGYIWAPGYWNWRGNHHVWAKGTWVRERRGYAYHSPSWVEHNGRTDDVGDHNDHGKRQPRAHSEHRPPPGHV